jgi:hypothetical protein
MNSHCSFQAHKPCPTLTLKQVEERRITLKTRLNEAIFDVFNTKELSPDLFTSSSFHKILSIYNSTFNLQIESFLTYRNIQIKFLFNWKSRKFFPLDTEYHRGSAIYNIIIPVRVIFDLVQRTKTQKYLDGILCQDYKDTLIIIFDTIVVNILLAIHNFYEKFYNQYVRLEQKALYTYTGPMFVCVLKDFFKHEVVDEVFIVDMEQKELLDRAIKISDLIKSYKKKLRKEKIRINNNPYLKSQVIKQLRDELGQEPTKDEFDNKMKNEKEEENKRMKKVITLQYRHLIMDEFASTPKKMKKLSELVNVEMIKYPSLFKFRKPKPKIKKTNAITPSVVITKTPPSSSSSASKTESSESGSSQSSQSSQSSSSTEGSSSQSSQSSQSSTSAEGGSEGSISPSSPKIPPKPPMTFSKFFKPKTQEEKQFFREQEPGAPMTFSKFFPKQVPKIPPLPLLPPLSQLQTQEKQQAQSFSFSEIPQAPPATEELGGRSNVPGVSMSDILPKLQKVQQEEIHSPSFFGRISSSQFKQEPPSGNGSKPISPSSLPALSIKDLVKGKAPSSLGSKGSEIPLSVPKVSSKQSPFSLPLPPSPPSSEFKPPPLPPGKIIEGGSSSSSSSESSKENAFLKSIEQDLNKIEQRLGDEKEKIDKAIEYVHAGIKVNE